MEQFQYQSLFVPIHQEAVVFNELEWARQTETFISDYRELQHYNFDPIEDDSGLYAYDIQESDTILIDQPIHQENVIIDVIDEIEFIYDNQESDIYIRIYFEEINDYVFIPVHISTNEEIIEIQESDLFVREPFDDGITVVEPSEPVVIVDSDVLNQIADFIFERLYTDDTGNKEEQLIGDMDNVVESVREIHFNYGTPYFPGNVEGKGSFISTSEKTTVSITPTANRVYYIPFYIPYPVLLKQLGIFITTKDIASRARIGVYNFDRGTVKEKIFDNQFALDSFYYTSTPVHLYLTAGLYMLAFLTESTTVKVWKNSIARSILGTDTPDGGTDKANHLYEDISAFADGLPSEAGTTKLSYSDSPRIIVGLG